MLPEFNPTLSDVFILVGTIFAGIFFLSYTFGGGWWRVKRYGWIGVMTFLHSFSVAALLFLIVWGIVFGQRVEEAVRLPIAVCLALAMVAKVVILHYERRQGRIMRREAHRKEKAHGPEQVSGGVPAARDHLGDGAAGSAR